MQVAILWARKQMRSAPQAILVGLLNKFLELLQVKVLHRDLRTLFSAVMETRLPALLPAMGAVLESFWKCMTVRASVDDDDEGEEMSIGVMQEAEAPLQRLRHWLLGSVPAHVELRPAVRWAELCSSALRSFGGPVTQWVFARVEVVLRQALSGPVDSLDQVATDAALALFAQTAESLMEREQPFVNLLELVVALQERAGPVSAYEALAAAIEFWERDSEVCVLPCIFSH
jgi:hypothetical protein